MVAEPKDLRSRTKNKNKREYFRLNEHIKIVVQPIKKPLKDKITGETKIEKTGIIAELITSDISADGLQFFSERRYRDNMHVEITLYFKETNPHFDPLTVTARITRAEQVENSQYQNVSVMYVNINPKDRSHIERYVFIRQREMIAEGRIGFL